jgi:hypothetical protein
MKILSTHIKVKWKNIDYLEKDGIIYKPYYGYYISNYGDIKSDSGVSTNKYRYKNYEYIFMYVYDDRNKRKRITFRVNRIMCLVFYGKPISWKYEAHHKNGIKTDNRLNNLIWVDPNEHRHITKNENRYKKGSDVVGSKLNKCMIDEISQLLLNGYTDTEISQFFKVKYNIKISRVSISNIRHKKTWTHETKEWIYPETIGPRGSNNGGRFNINDIIKMDLKISKAQRLSPKRT